ncbi:MAG TPA: MFS transporter [Bryobacteraceae bacterium]|nr:MFS transporter [Bryobacteraceae bacterium]
MAPRIPRNVIVLGFVSLLADISSEMLYPVIPLFVTAVLGAPVSIVGLIEGAAESTASLMRIASGWWSDRLRRRRPFVVSGYALTALTRLLLAAAHAWAIVLVARVLDRFGKGLRSAPRDALIADSTPAEIRGRAFGLHRSMDQLGAVAGPLLGIWLIGMLAGDYRRVFLIAFLPAAASAACVFLASEQRPAEAANRPHLSFRAVPPRFRRFLLCIAVFSIGNSSDAFLILRANQLGYGTQAVMVLFALFNATHVLSAFPAGTLSDRVNRRGVLVCGFTIFALVYAGFGLVSGPHWLWLLFGAYGVYHGLADGVSRALVIDLVPAGTRGTALGLHAATVGLVAFPASVIAGILWSSMGPAAPFLFGAAMAAAAAALLWLRS